MVSVGPTLTTKYELLTVKHFANKHVGGHDGSYYDEILEFDPVNGQWKMVDRMIDPRAEHAVSVIDYESVLCV